MDRTRVEYKVDRDNRVVIAMICGCGYDATDKINHNFIQNVTSDITMDYTWRGSKYLIPNAFKAVARCCPEDEFDEEIGKRIALNRLIDKYERSINKRLAAFIVDMDKVINKMSKSLEGKSF